MAQHIPTVRAANKEGDAEVNASLMDNGDGAYIDAESKYGSTFGPNFKSTTGIWLTGRELREWADTLSALAVKYPEKQP